MTRERILTNLFTSKEFIQCIDKMDPASLRDELKAEVGLILCEMDEAKLIGLAERGELKYYTVRIIINQIQSKSSPFYKKFRIPVMPAEFLPELPDTGYDDSGDRAISEIENLYWYDAELMKMYAEHGTYRKIEQLTGIPFESVYKTITRACKEIKMKVAV